MDNIIPVAEEEMKKAIDSLNHQFTRIRAGRANPAILDPIRVDYYGTPTPIQQMASVSVSESRTLVIEPWDKSALGELEKALQKADLGINPANDGNVVRLNFPQPTEERRKELVRDVKAIAEECKVMVRNARRDANTLVRELEDVSEDQMHRMEEDIQELTDKYTENIDDVAAAKEKEILEI